MPRRDEEAPLFPDLFDPRPFPPEAPMTGPVQRHTQISRLRDRIERGDYAVAPKDAPSIQERLDLENERLATLRRHIEQTLGLQRLPEEQLSKLWTWVSTQAGRGGPKEILGIYSDLAPTLLEIAEKGVGYVDSGDRAFARGYRLGAHDAAEAILEHATPELEVEIHRLAQVVRSLAEVAPRAGEDGTEEEGE